MMEYKIPEEILSKIPQHFWPAFAGELISTFGLMIFEKEECTDLYALYYYNNGLRDGFKRAKKIYGIKD